MASSAATAAAADRKRIEEVFAQGSATQKQLDDARSAADRTAAALAGAEQNLARLEHGNRPEEIRIAEAQAELAKARLAQIEKNFVVPVPQRSGAPLLTINPKAALPFGGKTYDGTGFVSSGFLTPQGNSPAKYTLTFPKPGTFDYDCLVPPGMDGSITVLP